MIYCVEDDANIRELVVYTLKITGFKARGYGNAPDFYEALSGEKPELVLLDIMLPGESGMDILKRLKSDACTASIPVIMLTAKGDEYDKVLGLDGGADDYMTKPFGMMELVSRIKAVLRRSLGQKSPGKYTLGAISLDTEKREVSAGDSKIMLTFKEFEILKLLMQNKNIVLTRNRLLEEVWGYAFDGGTRTVDVHIRTLRQKLGSSGEQIKTVRGVGYRMGE